MCCSYFYHCQTWRRVLYRLFWTLQKIKNVCLIMMSWELASSTSLLISCTTSTVASHTLELLLKFVAKNDEKCFEMFIERGFSHNWQQVCLHPISNYCVQTILENIKSKMACESICTKILAVNELCVSRGNLIIRWVEGWFVLIF